MNLKCHMNGKKNNKIKNDSTISYEIESIQSVKNNMMIQGWAISKESSQPVRFRLEDSRGESIKIKVTRTDRTDIVESGLASSKDRNCGFIIEFEMNGEDKYKFYITDGIRKKEISINGEKVLKKQKMSSGISFIRRSVKYMKPEYAKKLADYIRKYGVKNLKQYVKRAVNKTGKPYEEWYEENKVTEDELQKQRSTVFEKQPLISIVVPTYKTPINFLREMIDSVINQSYSNWELCIADGSEGDAEVEKELER